MVSFLLGVAAVTGVSILTRVALERLLLEPGSEAAAASRGVLGS
ncbi:hypothetical protein [Belnapia moabensis]|nr:hypothetical protein [Belnapia moabensis]